MSILGKIKLRSQAVLRLLCSRGGLSVAVYRLWLFVHRIDISFISVEDLGLQEGLAHDHCTSGGPRLANVLKKMNVKPGDCIVDVGCGKGGALITLSKFPFSRVAGVELCESLVHAAEANLRKLGLRNVELHCCDAVAFPGYDDFNYIYMFNPFPAPIMSMFLKSISESLDRRPRELTLLYYRPDCHDTVMSSGVFELVAEFGMGPGKSNIARIYRGGPGH